MLTKTLIIKKVICQCTFWLVVKKEEFNFVNRSLLVAHACPCSKLALSAISDHFPTWNVRYFSCLIHRVMVMVSYGWSCFYFWPLNCPKRQVREIITGFYIRLSKLKMGTSSFGGNKNGRKIIGIYFRQKIARAHCWNCLPPISIPVPL